MNRNIDIAGSMPEASEENGAMEGRQKASNRGSGPAMKAKPGKKEYLGFYYPVERIKRIRLAAVHRHKQPGDYIWDAIEERVSEDLAELHAELGLEDAGS